jgi:hypothetical protein
MAKGGKSGFRGSLCHRGIQFLRRWAFAARLRAEAGFGLVEGLVASLVLIVGIGATITVFVSSGHAGATAERHQAAVALAQEEIERIRSMPYDEIGLVNTTYPFGGLGGDIPNPAERIDSGYYVPANGTEPGGRLPAERLVVSDAERSFGIVPYERVSIESRSGTETAHVFRFVTWRDEECPLLKLSDLNLNLASLGQTVSGLVQSLTLSLGNNGLLGTAQNSKNILAGLQPVTSSVTNQVNQLLAAVDQLIGPVNRLINQVIAPIADQLVASLSRLTGIDLSLDLCDLDVSSVANLRTIKNALGALESPLKAITAAKAQEAKNSIQQATDKAVEAVEEDRRCESLPAVARVLCRAVSGLLQGLINTLNGLVNGVVHLLLGSGGQPGIADVADEVPPNINASLGNATDGLLTDLSQLPSFINATVDGLDEVGTDENTKRVLVAVVLEHGGPAGPRQPIWMSTVVTDPYAGLLQP